MRRFSERRRRRGVVGLVVATAGVAALLASVALLAAAAAGIAAPPAPHGALVSLSGRGSCLGYGCAPLRGIRGDSNLNGVQLTVGAGGGTIYAAGGTPWAIAVLQRDPSTGAITQLSGPRGCIVSRRTKGCAFVPASGADGLAVSADGKRVAASVSSPKSGFDDGTLFARNPRTGALRRIGGSSPSCVALLGTVCGHLRGLSDHRFLDFFPLTLNTRIVVGSAAHIGKAPGGLGIAIQRRGAGGRWSQASGSGGCTTSLGSPGCGKLRCLQSSVTEVAPARDGHHVYIIGGKGAGYLATFRQFPNGGLKPVGCVPSDPAGSISGEPVWVSALPHSSTVLLAGHYYDHESGLEQERIDAATPGPGGPLQRPRQISGNLGFSSGTAPILAPDGETLYGADTDGGQLYVYRVTPDSVTALAAPYANPYSTPKAPTGLHYYGITSPPVSSPDGRFVYVATAPASQAAVLSAPGTLTTSASTPDRYGLPPGIRVFRVQR